MAMCARLLMVGQDFELPKLIKWEFPPALPGGSKSLTFPGVEVRGAIDETTNREPPKHTKALRKKWLIVLSGYEGRRSRGFTPAEAVFLHPSDQKGPGDREHDRAEK